MAKKIAKKPSKKKITVKKIVKKAKAPAQLTDKTNLRAVCAAVHEVLNKHGHEPVLTGEACAALYSGNTIKPKTVEFVIRNFSMETVAGLMKKIGFTAKEYHSFANKKCPYEIILQPQPLVVGDDIVGNVDWMKTKDGNFKLLNPTDCVRHRLSSYFKFGERMALVEAVSVARKKKIDMDLVRRWAEWEWASDRFEEFKRELDAAVSNKV